MNATTLPELRAEYESARLNLIIKHAATGKTQTQAAKTLGVTLTSLNNIIKRKGIHWPVIQQGQNK